MDIDTLILYYTVRNEVEAIGREAGIEVTIDDDNIEEVFVKEV